MNLNYRAFTNADYGTISSMMRSLYSEDPGDRPMTAEKTLKTLQALTDHPNRGTILLLENDGRVIGYSVLINFWSNEFGGNILNIDELYIIKEYRSKGVGSDFIKYLGSTKFAGAVMLQLETTPGNLRARKLYKGLGFRPHKNDTFDLELNPPE